VTPKPEIRLVAGAADAPEGPKGTRLFHERGAEMEATVWQRGSLRQGTEYEGPMVVEQYDTTIYVPAGFRVTVDDHANLIGERT
jgi:N-methylhydantoinase A